MSQEELCFLPAVPCPDAPEQKDKSVANSLKLVESNHSASPLSVDAVQNGHAVNHETSPVEGIDFSAADDVNGGRLKRKQKPSEKVLESQAEMIKKPVKKTKPSAKATLKPKDKVLVDEDNGFSICG